MFLFSAGDTEKYWNLRLIDDDVFENKETFTLELHDPVMAVIEEPRRARVTIVDDEDGKMVTYNLITTPITNITPLPLLMLGLLSHYAQKAKIYENHLNPVMLVFI